MTTEHEIEFKNLLTREDFERLSQYFPLPTAHEQTNTYFDTPDFKIKALGGALRIRSKGERYECTLKLPHESGDGLNEFTQQIPKAASQHSLEQLNTATHVLELLSQAGIAKETLIVLTSLKTFRRELAFQGGLLVFDESFYSDVHDFELEFEYHSFEQGQAIFQKLLADYEIPVLMAHSKIKRAMLAAAKQHNTPDTVGGE
ncbi:MAG: CYTH domain-containing protein [Culicoidibacterales bacterium]